MPSTTGWPEAVTHLRLPQNVACRFPALRSSEIASQHGESLELPVREIQLGSQQWESTVTQLRKMMLEELERCNYSKGTIRYYLRFVERFGGYIGLFSLSLRTAWRSKVRASPSHHRFTWKRGSGNFVCPFTWRT